MGHPNIRDTWGPEEAMGVGGLVASIIHGTEAAFSHYAPRLFPNVLTDERRPVSTVEILKRELNRLDQIADNRVTTTAWNDRGTAETWTTARENFRKYMDAEDTFISTAEMLHWRYFDERTPLHIRLLRYRIEFLTDLLSHFSSPLDENPTEEDGNTAV
jgi:hypothetical protein